MSYCPVCHQEINSLIRVTKEIHESEVTLMDDGELTIGWDERGGIVIEEWFVCPKCRRYITSSNPEAKEILRGDSDEGNDSG